MLVCLEGEMHWTWDFNACGVEVTARPLAATFARFPSDSECIAFGIPEQNALLTHTGSSGRRYPWHCLARNSCKHGVSV